MYQASVALPFGSSEKCNVCLYTGGDYLEVRDWLADVAQPQAGEVFDCVEVRFKNGRKGFYRNVNRLPLSPGDIVAVESSPGHDIGCVMLTGQLARMQMRRKKEDPSSPELPEGVPFGHPEGYRRVADGHCAGAKDTGAYPRDLRQPGAGDEVERCRVPGRQSEGNVLLYGRGSGRFPPVDQGTGQCFRCADRDASDRSASGGCPGGRHRLLRAGIVLHYVADGFPFGQYVGGTHPATFAQPAEIGRTVRKTQVLPEFRVGCLRRCLERFPAYRCCFAHGEGRSPFPEDGRIQRHLLVCIRFRSDELDRSARGCGCRDPARPPPGRETRIARNVRRGAGASPQ